MSMVNHPEHYNHGKLEVIDIIKDQLEGAPIKPFEGGLFFNVVKYILRAPYKKNKTEDLNKAKWYLECWIKLLEKSDDNE
ncbi:hypothetical protein [Lactobacillus phage Semele]|uniref:DUF3310 domain-containing protein n=1 Tax=Lactobacillus phage Semele TaxID=2079433 RepID=A0A2K9VDA6_9CAUD|nr:nucleotide kinase [Lactobacillus phage Semele]AUV60180.1 hypothetical protein [Lactobacillus phage Semele]